MKNILLVLLAVIVASCTTDLKQYQTAENSAMSSVHVPLFASITDIMSDNSFKSLMPGQVVYFTGDSAVGNNIPYVKVVWGDSSAYARANMLMPRGHWAVVTATGQHMNIDVYDNANLDNAVESIGIDWQLLVVGEAKGKGTPMLYQGMGGQLLTGYVITEFVLDDSLNVEYYNAYHEAQRRNQAGDYAALTRLSIKSRYAQLKTFGWRASMNDVGETVDERGDAETGEDDSPYAEGDAEYGDYYDEGETMRQEHDWMYGENMLTADEAPGTVRKYFVMEDGTEMSAEGYRMSNGYPYNEQDGATGQTVKRIRFEVTLKAKGSIHFDVTTFDGPGYQHAVDFTEDFEGEAGKAYSVFVGDSTDNAMILCAIIRATITIEGSVAVATVSGDCGD